MRRSLETLAVRSDLLLLKAFAWAIPPEPYRLDVARAASEDDLLSGRWTNSDFSWRSEGRSWFESDLWSKCLL
jgi:hypothetical protein